METQIKMSSRPDNVDGQPTTMELKYGKIEDDPKKPPPPKTPLPKIPKKELKEEKINKFTAKKMEVKSRLVAMEKTLKETTNNEEKKTLTNLISKAFGLYNNQDITTYKLNKAAAEVERGTAKAALLERLGITEDEAKLLLA